jgi:hypothetical protein
MFAQVDSYTGCYVIAWIYYFKGTVSEFRGSNDFIVQKVYLLRLMPVCVNDEVQLLRRSWM